MWQAIRPLLIITTFGDFMDGCGNNPVSPSDSQSSGSLQYTFSTPKTTYISGDTLTAAITVHNSGSVADTIGVDASFFTWALVNSSGDTVMRGGGGFSLGQYIPLQPGQSQKIDMYAVKKALTGSSGTAFPAGAYSLEATLQTWNITAKSGVISFLLKLSVQ